MSSLYSALNLARPLAFSQPAAGHKKGRASDPCMQGSAMSIVEKYNDLVAEYSGLASIIGILRSSTDFDRASVADCAALFEAHAFTVLERHSKLDSRGTEQVSSGDRP